MELLIIRHGETLANTLNHYYGFTDSPVTEKGIIQAKAAGFVLNKVEYHPSRIFISERERTRITLEVMGFNPEDAKVDSRINEQNMGIFENMTYEEIGEKYPEEFKRWNDDYLNHIPTSGESRKNLYDRVKDFFEEITEKYKNSEERILVVCHGGVMSSFYTYLIGENFKETYSAYFGNCAMLKVKYMSGKLVLESLIAAEDFMRILK